MLFTRTQDRPGKHRGETGRRGARRAVTTLALAAGLAVAPALTSTASASEYTVRSGDTLSSIAQGLGTTWQDLYAANRGTVSSPTTIYPGQTLTTSGGGSTTQAAPAATSSASSGTSTGGVLAAASSLQGTPYVYGGTTPAGFDCSGFTSYAFAQAGKTIPRTSSAQAAAATPVPAGSQRPGDLVFFSPGGSVSHVAIYAGNGMVWEAASSGTSVRYAPMWDVPRSYGRF